MLEKITLGTTIGVVAGATLAPVVVVGGLSLIGFGSGGVVAGSYAAGWMSTFGGAVPAGSMFATCQSLGALGVVAASNVPTVTIGAVLGGVVAKTKGWMG